MAPPDRERVRAEIEGPENVPVQVVASTQFVQGTSTSQTGGSVETELLGADTTGVALPSTVERELTETDRFYIEVAMTDSTGEKAGTGPIAVQVKLFVDDEQRATVSGDLRETSVKTSFRSFVSAALLGGGGF